MEFEDFSFTPKEYKRKQASKKQIAYVKNLLEQNPSLKPPESEDQVVIDAWLGYVTTALAAAGSDDPYTLPADYESLEPSLESLQDFSQFDLAMPDLV